MEKYTVDKLLEVVKSDTSKNIGIYGAGKYAHILLNICKINSVDVKKFFVTSLDNNLKKIDEIPVVQFNKDDYYREWIFLLGIKESSDNKLLRQLCGLELNILPLPTDIDEYDVWDNYQRYKNVVQVTTVIGCNVNCRYCPQDKLVKAYYKENKNRKRLLSLSDYKICLEKLPKDTLIEFAGMSEPFQNQECIEMMRLTDQMGFEMSLFTTLKGCNMKIMQEIKDMNIKETVIHVADSKGYANIPVTKESLELLEYVIDLKKKDGSSFVNLVNSQCEPDSSVAKICNGKFYISYNGLYDRAGNLDGEKDLHKSPFKAGKVMCEPSPNLTNNILLPDGSLLLCCNDYSMEHVIGNLLDESYEEIMNGDRLKSIKNRMLCKEDGSLLCRKCISAKVIG